MDRTIQIISKALDAALMRQTAIANNIANVYTPGYHSVKVHFEEQLDSLTGFLREDAAPVYQESTASPVIDEELANGVKNTTHYQALIKGLNHKLAIMKLALQGNHAS